MFRQPQALKLPGRKASRSSRRASRCLLPCADSLESRLLLAAVQPTDYEQYMLELINRARATPNTEASLYGIDLNGGIAIDNTILGTPKQPLALNLFLIDAARQHSQDMIDRDYFAHNTLEIGRAHV